MGTPDDVPGQCNAHLYIADDYGDNHATMRCQLAKGHEGPHQEKYRDVAITWIVDEREEEKRDIART